MAEPLRVAYTLEQCWHRVPGGTAVAALEVLRELALRPELEMVAVAGTHGGPPVTPWDPGMPISALPGAGARLYAGWVFAGRPIVERVTGPVQVAHATSIIACASRAPLVATVHDLAFLHEPAHFTRWGRTLFRASLARLRRRGALVLCSSQATADDCVHAGLDASRVRIVPLGVRPPSPVGSDEARAIRARLGLPDGYVLSVGTLEPRKNLARLAEAVQVCGLGLDLVVVGPDGWGDAGTPPGVRCTGFLSAEELAAVYAGASVVAYPSLREGFGLPVLEAMAAGAPVVTSLGTATEEVAGDAAVLVEPTSISSIAAGLGDAFERRAELIARGRVRAATFTWSRTAELTAAAYAEAAA